MVPKTQYEGQKKNYNVMMEKIIKSMAEKKKLLLHACCAPCSSHVLELLSQYFDITIYYYNPNIHPKTEYERRLSELEDFLKKFPEAKNVKLITENYNPEEYFEATNTKIETELQTENEKGERCRRCYLFRMKKAFEYAVKNNFHYFTTTLSISPFKDSEKINTIGFSLEEEFKAISENIKELETKFLPSDFKKKGGFLRSLQISEEYSLYRQEYCGCIYSLNNKKI